MIIAAMAPELAPFLDRATEVGGPTPIGHAEFWRGRLDGQDAILVRSGIGLVNAASAMTIAAIQHQPRLVVSVGTAGGIRGRVSIGDVVVGKHVGRLMATLGGRIGALRDAGGDPALLAQRLAQVFGASASGDPMGADAQTSLRVTTFGVLDLDHVRPELPQQLGGKRTGDELSKLYDFKSIERKLARCHNEGSW